MSVSGVLWGVGFGEYYPNKKLNDEICNEYLNFSENLRRKYLLAMLPIDENGTYTRFSIQLTKKWSKRYNECFDSEGNTSQWDKISGQAEYETAYRPDTPKDWDRRSSVIKRDRIARIRRDIRKTSIEFVARMFLSGDLFPKKLIPLAEMRLVCKKTRKKIDNNFLNKHLPELDLICTRKNLLYKSDFSTFLHEVEMDEAVKTVLISALKTGVVAQGCISPWPLFITACFNPAAWPIIAGVGAVSVITAFGAAGAGMYYGNENIKDAEDSVKKSKFDLTLKKLFEEKELLKYDVIYSEFSDRFLKWKIEKIKRNYDSIEGIKNDDFICPITSCFIKIPVIVSNPKIPFEYDQPEIWIKEKGTHPVVTDQKVTMDDIRLDAKRFYKSRKIVNRTLERL